MFRHRTVDSPLGRDLLIVSNRVSPSGVATLRRLHAQLDDPLVIAAGACPAAAWFWDRSPSGWVDVAELLDVDHQIDACLTGHPEVVLETVLRLALSGSTKQPLFALTEAI